MLTSNVPKDVVIEILSRLPTETLVRFKLVRKSWHSLIESSQFVAMQLRNHVLSLSPDNDKSLYLLVKTWKFVGTTVDKSILSVLTHDDRRKATSSGDDVAFAMRNVDLPLPFCNGLLHISNECDGIICLYGGTHTRDSTIIIANLEIREFRALSDSCIPIPIEDYCHIPRPCYSETKGVAFGFDRKTNNYKVVRILQFYSQLHTPDEGLEAEVYSLKSNSWKQIECFEHWIRLVFYSGYHLSSYWNGVYYWPAVHCRGLYDAVYGLASFDFSDEAFQFIAFPEHLSQTFKGPKHFGGIIVFHGTHALISYPKDNCFDIWLMDEVGNSETWTKLLTISPILELSRPLAFWKSNEILVLLSDGQVASYNIVTNQMKNLPIFYGDLRVEVMTYKSSLVSIN